MATTLERRIWGANLIVFGAAQYAVTSVKLWKSPVPTWWIREAATNGLGALARDESFEHTSLMILGPIVSITVGASLFVMKHENFRAWSLRVAALASLVILSMTISAWELALFAPLFVFYALALIWLAARTFPRVEKSAGS